MALAASRARSIASLDMAPESVVGLAEVAEMLQRDKDTVLAYSKRPDFPEPLARLASGPVWETRRIERWAAKVLPQIRPGRPRKRRS
jgi:hypothetical protein